MNSTTSDNERRHCVTYALGLSSRNPTILIPPEYDQIESFIPSWGPKVNPNIFCINIDKPQKTLN